MQRLLAHACLAVPGTEVEQARARADAGDVDWRDWVREFDRGDATLIDLRVNATVELDDGSPRSVEVTNHQIWMHLAQHPPVVAGLVAEMATKDLKELAERMQELNGQITVDELGEMYFSVELDDDLLAALRPRGAAAKGDGARPGSETTNA